MRDAETNRDRNDAAALALNALVWVLQEPDRADRFLALTGLEGDDIRGRINDPALLDGVIAFLEAHEPDLIACAHALDVSPGVLIGARSGLGA
jgi:Protein of unknown function (DUF3572)